MSSVCDMKCFECKFEDCINQSPPTLDEYKEIRKLESSVLKEAEPEDYGVGSRTNRKPYYMKYYKKHREEHLQRCATYRETHQEQRKETLKNYYDNNRDVILERQRKFYQDNLEEYRLKKRLYYQEHKDEINRKRRERRKLANENSKN